MHMYPLTSALLIAVSLTNLSLSTALLLICRYPAANGRKRILSVLFLGDVMVWGTASLAALRTAHADTADVPSYLMCLCAALVLMFCRLRVLAWIGEVGP